MSIHNPQRFDVGVKGLIADGDNVLLVRQSSSWKWEIPGGRINVGEETTDLTVILQRELEEELGKGFAFKIDQLFQTSVRSWTGGSRKGDFVFLVTYRCTYIGGKVTLSDEHTESAWVDAESLPSFDVFPDLVAILKKHWSKQA